MRLNIYYPVKPHKINRQWGFPSPEYKQFGFTLHNGIDINLANGTPIFAPLEADILKVGNVPNGSGIFVSMLSSQPYTFDDGKEVYTYIEFFHCQEIKVKEGDHVLPGQLLALGDNTGFSTGSHTHMQPRRMRVVAASSGAVYIYKIKGVDSCLVPFDSNDANNTFDPTPYFNNLYAFNIRPFFRDLSIGSKGEDVTFLQKLLNSDKETRIAIQGLGSPGNESDTFGQLTKNALQKFQSKYNLSKVGNSNYGTADSLTRDKLQEIFDTNPTLHHI